MVLNLLYPLLIQVTKKITKIVIKQELINTELETFILPAPETYVLVYVLMISPKTLAKIENTKHLKKLFGVRKLVNFVGLKTLKQSPLGKWSTMRAQLNVLFLDDFVGKTLKPSMILLNIQCGANLTLLSLHKQIPIADIATKQTRYTNC